MVRAMNSGAASMTDESAVDALVRALAVAGGNVSLAARTLGVARSTVHRMKRRYGLGFAKPWPFPLRELLVNGYLQRAETNAMIAELAKDGLAIKAIVRRTEIGNGRRSTAAVVEARARVAGAPDHDSVRFTVGRTVRRGG